MSTNATPTTPTTQPAKPKAEKGSRSFSITMAGDAGTLKISAQAKKDGTATTFAVLTTKDGKKKKTNTRGASSEHPDLDKAKGAAERLAVEAVKRGWVRKERAAGFTPKADAFTAANLPSASKPSKK
jgi:hypothetical protein